MASVTWDANAFRFRRDGRFIARATVRLELEKSLANLTKLTDSLAGDLRSGRISLMDWRQEMRDIIKVTQMAAHEIASGGREQMTPADYGRVGQRTRVQYEYLEKWTFQIASGRPLGPELESRSRQYLTAGRVAFLAHDQRNMQTRGFDEIRSVLHPAEHCAECIAEAARGFVPIGEHIAIGSRQCLGNDQCTAEYRNSQTGQILAA